MSEVKGSFQFDFRNVDDGGGSGVQYLKEPGKYKVKATKITKQESKSSEYPYFRWHLEVIEGPHKGAVINHTTSLHPNALFNLRNTIMAIMDREVPKAVVKIDFGALLHRPFGIRVERKPRRTDGREFAEVVATFPARELDSDVPPFAVEDDVEDFGAESLDESDLG